MFLIVSQTLLISSKQSFSTKIHIFIELPTINHFFTVYQNFHFLIKMYIIFQKIATFSWKYNFLIHPYIFIFYWHFYHLKFFYFSIINHNFSIKVYFFLKFLTIYTIFTCHWNFCYFIKMFLFFHKFYKVSQKYNFNFFISFNHLSYFHIHWFFKLSHTIFFYIFKIFMHFQMFKKVYFFLKCLTIYYFFCVLSNILSFNQNFLIFYNFYTFLLNIISITLMFTCTTTNFFFFNFW